MFRRVFRHLFPGRKALSPVDELRQELSRTVGYFSLSSSEVPSRNLWGGNAVVYSHLKAFNAWPKVTIAHEQAHYRLINSTPFGLFCKLLQQASHLDKRKLANPLAETQWTTQEAAATYIGLGALALDKEKLDRAISSLPSATLNGAPYREAFDLVDELFPLEETNDISTISASVILVEAMATWALSSDILTHFKTPARVKEELLTEHLAVSGPDARFKELVSRLRRSEEVKNILADVRGTISAVAEQFGGFPDTEFWSLVSRLQDFVALGSTIDLERRWVIMGQFARAWSATSEAESGRAWDDETEIAKSEINMLPEVVVGDFRLTPFAPGWVDLAASAAVELGYPIESLEQNSSERMALFLAVQVPTPQSQVYFRPTVYRVREDEVNPTHPDAAMVSLFQQSGPIHECEADAFVDAVAGLPVRLSAISFLGNSWTHWHIRGSPAGVPITAGSFGPPFKDGLGNCVRVCMEINLSLPHLLVLLAGVGLNNKPECFLFDFGGAEHVACLLDRDKPGVYLLQLVSGEAGYSTFDKIARTEQFRMLEVADGTIDLPHLPLLTFLSKALVFEAAAAGGQGLVL